MKNLELSDIDIINKITVSENITESYRGNFIYVLNKDGTIRWLYPTNLKNPSFLSFYNSSTVRSKIFIWLTIFLYKIRIFNLFFGTKISLLIHKNSFVDKLIKNKRYDNFSIFFGTVGANKKIIFKILKVDNSSSYIKYSISNKSSKLIDNESFYLKKILKTKNKTLSVPSVINEKKSIMVELSDIKIKNSIQLSNLENIHINAAIEISSHFQKYNSWDEIKNSYEFTSLFNSFKDLKSRNKFLDSKKLSSFSELALKNLEFINTNDQVLCSLSHGDFTPWNMYICKEKVFAFDWELASIGKPVLFDLFHFIFQSKTLLGNKSYNLFKKEIINLNKNSTLKNFCENNNVNLNKNYLFYLLFVSSYYLELYLNQEKIHTQAFWLFDNWNSAFKDFLDNEGNIFYGN